MFTLGLYGYGYVVCWILLSLLRNDNFLKILFIYLTEIISRQREREREEEAGSPLSREPDVGLDPRNWDHDLSRRQRL